jgi:hypothetical protein
VGFGYSDGGILQKVTHLRKEAFLLCSNAEKALEFDLTALALMEYGKNQRYLLHCD